MNTSTSTSSSASKDNICIIEISVGKNKGVNPLGKSTRRHIFSSLQSALSNPAVTAIVLTGGYKSKHFSAGADIAEFGKSDSNVGGDEEVPSLTSICNAIEQSTKPVVCAIRGVALGGGFEIVLSSHYRVADKSSKFGLPEVNIGLIPGAGGTQRLPRLIGVKRACDIILSGRMMNVKEALDLGVIDAAVVNNKESVEECAIRWAEYAAALGNIKSRQLCHAVVNKGGSADIAKNHKICDAIAKKLPPKHKGGIAAHSAISAIRASFSKPSFEEGMAVEEELFWDLLLTSQQGRGLRHAFFADRLARNTSGGGKNLKFPPRIESLLKTKVGGVGVIGAGTMGSGIALSLLRANYSPVYLVDNSEEGLKRGASLIKSLLQTDVSKKRITTEQASKISESLIPTTNMQDLSACVLVIEAVFEKLSLKQSIFSKLSSIVSDDTLLLSNTSTLDLNAIASSIPPNKNRARCAGMHFFSPAHVMKLVEIVTSSYTSPETIYAVQTVTQQIRKVGVVVGNCDGFVGNRMVFPYTSEMVFLFEENLVSEKGVKEIDDALMEFGMAIGPFIMSDLAGNDIGYAIRREKGLVRDPKTGLPGPNRPGRYTELADELVTKYGRVGQKALKGWYDYDRKIGKGRAPIPSKEVEQHIAKYASAFRKKNMLPSPPKKLSKEEIVNRILFPLVNEGFKILEENIAQRPSDIDVIYLYGYGWPNWRGKLLKV
uniref:Enoyl-CoA hydratase n=2 Tax=Ditylum brightwellii TaxID=49249 RepID=A0A7S4VVX6_9STRA